MPKKKSTPCINTETAKTKDEETEKSPSRGRWGNTLLTEDKDKNYIGQLIRKHASKMEGVWGNKVLKEKLTT